MVQVHPDATFKSEDNATIWLRPLLLPSGVTVWLVSVVVDRPTETVGFVVPLRTAKAFFAFQIEDSRKQRFSLPS